MTRKDYVALAAALALHQPPANTDTTRSVQFRNIVFSVADVLKANNPRFDRERFLKAAGAL